MRNLLSFRGASEASEPEIHIPQRREYGFRVRAFGASRNDEERIADV